MAYSNQTIKNNPASFPAPPLWMSWTERIENYIQNDGDGKPIKLDSGEWDYRERRSGDGVVRHHADLAQVKRQLGWLGRKARNGPTEWRGKVYGDGTFVCDWSVYEWVDGEWVLRYQGFRGEPRNANPMFQTRISKDGKVSHFAKVREQEAIDIVRSALNRVAS